MRFLYCYVKINTCDGINCIKVSGTESNLLPVWKILDAMFANLELLETCPLPFTHLAFLFSCPFLNSTQQ